MSQAKFEKAVAIVKALPPNGPIKPTDDDKLAVSFALPPLSPAMETISNALTDLSFSFHSFTSTSNRVSSESAATKGQGPRDGTDELNAVNRDCRRCERCPTWAVGLCGKGEMVCPDSSGYH